MRELLPGCGVLRRLEGFQGQANLVNRLFEMEIKSYAIFNPHNRPVESLPVIYGFNNGGSLGWGYSAVAIAEDGHCLGDHYCSREAYMLHDLGILEGTRQDRHTNDYQKHYPDGYRMAWVPTEEIETFEPLKIAFELNSKLPKLPEP